MDKRSIVIGVTGGTGCGVTVVSQLMKEWGGALVSGDQLARDIMQSGMPAFNAVVEAFGESILTSDGQLDRRGLGAIVFKDKEKLERLNKAVHPFWIAAIKENIAKARESGVSVIIVDAAILLETGLKSCVDKIVVVTAPLRLRRSRIMQRDDLDETQADQRIFSQVPVSEKISQADYVIENNGTLEQIKTKLEEIKADLLS